MKKYPDPNPMSDPQSRRRIVALLNAGRASDAGDFALEAAKRARRFSSDHLYAMVDYYAAASISNQLTATLGALFSPELIGHANLRDHTTATSLPLTTPWRPSCRALDTRKPAAGPWHRRPGF
jgi:hypothetical protein